MMLSLRQKVLLLFSVVIMFEDISAMKTDFFMFCDINHEHIPMTPWSLRAVYS